METIWNNLLTKFDSEESVAFMLFLIGAFLIGLLLAWLIHGGRARKRKREINRLQTEMTDWKVKNARLQEELELKDADLIRANREVEEWSETVKELHGERAQLADQLALAQQENQQLTVAANGYIDNIEALNNQIIGLKTRIGSGDAAGSGDRGDIAAVSARYENRLSEMEARLAQLETIRAELDATRGRGIENEPPLVAAAALPPETDGAEDSDPDTELGYSRNGDEVVEVVGAQTDDDLGILEDIDENGRAALTEQLGAKIPAPIVLGDRDDLTMIKGVGPFLQKQLNEIGVYNFEQIAGWSEGEIDRVTEAIGYFPGRILRDDWVGQASRLQEIQSNYPDALEVGIRAKAHNSDDLKIVEGIGPAIEKLLKENDVPDLVTLAQLSYEQLKDILSIGGNKFRMHDPMTWPDQANLAVAGKWKQLEDLQERLKGGK